MSLTLVAVHDDQQRNAIQKHLALHRIPSYIPDDYEYSVVAELINDYDMRAAIIEPCYAETICLANLQVVIVVLPGSSARTLVSSVQVGLFPPVTTIITTPHFTLDMGGFTYCNHYHQTRGMITRQEHQLLRVLLSEHTFISTVALFDRAWIHGDHVEAISERVGQVVKNIRSKIEPDRTNPRYLISHQGLGYRLCLP